MIASALAPLAVAAALALAVAAPARPPSANGIAIAVVDAGGGKPARVAVSVREAVPGAEPSPWKWREAVDGRVTIDGLVAGVPVAVRLRTESSAVAVTRALLPGDPAAVAAEVTLAPGRTLRGAVVDKATGAPLAGATVVAIAQGDPCALLDPATTGADGAFSIAGAPAAARSVRAVAAGRPPRSVPIGADDAIRVELDPEIGSGTKLSFDGPVTPGESWQVRFQRPGAAATSDVEAAGTFAVPPLPPGRYDAIFLRASESERWTWEFWVTSVSIPSRGAPRPVALRNALLPGEARARVTRAGAPAADVVLRAIPVGLPSVPLVLARTAADGVARLPSLPKARAWIAVEGTLAGAFCDVPESGATRVEIEIPAGRAAVTLREEKSGLPLPFSTVRLAHDDASGKPDAPPAPPLVAKTDASGVARFEALPPGTFVAEAGSDEGLLSQGRARVAVVLGAAEATAELRAVRGGFVAGSAFRDGAPIDRAVRLVLRDTGTGRVHSAEAARDGSFRVGPLAAGTHPLFARSESGDFSAGLLRVAAEFGATAIANVDLVRGGTLEVRVTAADPSQARRMRVLAEPKAPPGEPAWSDLVSPAERNEWLRGPAVDASGRTRIGPLPPGLYRVKAIGPDGAVVAEDDAAVTSGASAAVLLPLK